MSRLAYIKAYKQSGAVVDCVLDTDAYNEIDDQFAIAWLLKASSQVRLRALYAAPFLNERSVSPEDGMEKSFQEIQKLLNLAALPVSPPVFRGAARFLPDEHTPVMSDAARHLVQLAQTYTPEKPLYVLAIGAITNIASALLMEPAIAANIAVVWLGGHAAWWPHTREFNMQQDVAAARVVFNGAPLVQLPCMGVVDHLTVTGPELMHWLADKNPLADYLCRNTISEAERYAKGTAWSRVIWDVSAVAWLLDREDQMLSDRELPAPIPEYDHHYAYDFTRPPIRQVWRVSRDAIFTRLFSALTDK
jgi:hypothetical protein